MGLRSIPYTVKEYGAGAIFGIALLIFFTLCTRLIDTTPCVGPYELSEERFNTCTNNKYKED